MTTPRRPATQAEMVAEIRQWATGRSARMVSDTLHTAADLAERMAENGMADKTADTLRAIADTVLEASRRP